MSINNCLPCLWDISRKSVLTPNRRFPYAREICARYQSGRPLWEEFSVMPCLDVPKRNLSFSTTHRRLGDHPGRRRYDAAGRFRPGRSAHLRRAGRYPLPTLLPSSPSRSPSDKPTTFSDPRHPKRKRRACHSFCTFRGYHRQEEARSMQSLQRNCALESRLQM